MVLTPTPVQALTPAMIAWRKRLSFITERFEAANSKQKELPVAIAKVDNESKKEVSSQNASDLQEPSKASPVSNINKEDGTPASSEPLPALQRLSDSVQVEVLSGRRFMEFQQQDLILWSANQNHLSQYWRYHFDHIISCCLLQASL